MPSGHPPTPNSLIVGNCVACDGLVRVSATANAKASVRCPHCQQTFPLASLLESAVPEVEVVDPQVSAPSPPSIKKPKQNLYIDQTAEATKDASGKFVVPSQLAKGARRRKSSRSRSGSSRSRSSSGESESRSRSSSDRSESRTRERTVERGDRESRRTRSSENESRSSSSESVVQPNKRHRSIERSSDSSESSESAHRSTRHRDARAAEALKTAPNPAMDFLKVIAGVCLALPIAYLIVMWTASMDPIGIAEGLGERVPFLVPADLRGETESDVDDDTSSETGQSFFDDEENSLGSGSSSDSGFENFDIGGEALKGLDF